MHVLYTIHGQLIFLYEPSHCFFWQATMILQNTTNHAFNKHENISGSTPAL